MISGQSVRQLSAFALAATLCTTVALAANEREEREAAATAAPIIDVRPPTAPAGADVRVVVRVTPDTEDRWLRVAIESADFYSSTQRQLRGERSPRAFEFTWRALPASEYLVTVEVEDALGEIRSSVQPFTVHGPTEGCETESGMIAATCH